MDLRSQLSQTIDTKSPALLNAWLVGGSEMAAETLLNSGWDAITLDCQHGWWDPPTLYRTIRFIDLHQRYALVRIANPTAPELSLALDAGAHGVICAGVDSPAQAEAFIKATRYAPQGHRSVGLSPAVLQRYPRYYQTAAQELALLIMIESRQAVQNLPEFARLENLTGFYIGPSDLGVSYGFPAGLDRKEPEVIAAIAQITQCAQKHQLAVGMHHGSASNAAQLRKHGVGLHTLLNEQRALAQTSQTTIAAYRQALDEP
jgi:4-hydroxy-2-oxoheptanedioate aldolase